MARYKPWIQASPVRQELTELLNLIQKVISKPGGEVTPTQLASEGDKIISSLWEKASNVNAKNRAFTNYSALVLLAYIRELRYSEKAKPASSEFMQVYTNMDARVFDDLSKLSTQKDSDASELWGPIHRFAEYLLPQNKAEIEKSVDLGALLNP